MDDKEKIETLARDIYARLVADRPAPLSPSQLTLAQHWEDLAMQAKVMAEAFYRK
jgi:hypothetical protein